MIEAEGTPNKESRMPKVEVFIGAASPPKTTLPARHAVLVCRLDARGELYPITRLDDRTDGHWQVSSGSAKAAACLTLLEQAHECCMKQALHLAAEAAVAGLERRALNVTTPRPAEAGTTNTEPNQS